MAEKEEAYDSLIERYEDKCTDVEVLEEKLKLIHVHASKLDAKICVLQEESEEMAVNYRKFEHAQDQLDEICTASGVTHDVDKKDEKTGKSLDGTISIIHNIISKQGKDNQKIIERNSELENENSTLKEKLNAIENKFEFEIQNRSKYIDSIVSITEKFYHGSKMTNFYSNLKSDK